MPRPSHRTGDFSREEMAELVGVFIDETDTQCDQLVESLLALEKDPAQAEQIAITFRMVHSIKGSAGMLGFDPITAVAHQLESHFERLRSGTVVLDRRTVEVALACIDYFRDCTERLAQAAPLNHGQSLIEAVKGLVAAAPIPAPPAESAPASTPTNTADERQRLVRIRLAAGLALPDAKAHLLLKRLSSLGVVVRSDPPPAEFGARPDQRVLDVVLRSGSPPAAILAAADADGVESVELDPTQPAEPATERLPPVRPDEHDGNASQGPPASTNEPAAVAETIRVAVDRLDVLLDLAGEMVVNRARFAQLVTDLAPVFRKPAARTAEWEGHQRRYGELVESVDQLTRVVENLQRGVLGTRMVPIGPLFGRFRRSIRDIAHELGKQVVLEVVGEQTEIDKRMVDELGDPLVHLVRNAIDHGIESAEVRAAAGKPVIARLRLEASHRGNEVVIAVTDDGGGIDPENIRSRAVARGLISPERAAALQPRELIELIWEPGFSTAEAVSNISGRGVGMDIVRTRIAGLSGSIEVESTLGAGTTFTMRLPLTLAISRCMLVRLADTPFAIPVEHVREIVTVAPGQVVSVADRRVCDIRGEFLPLVDLGRVFTWRGGPPPDVPAAAVLVIRAGGRVAAIGVPALLGTRDLVIKPLDDNFRRVRGLGGAGVLGDGEVCLLIDAATLIDMAVRTPAGE